MQPTRILFLLAAVLLTQSVVAQGLPGLVKALEARIQVLEDSAPSSSVEGRTYCSVLTQTILRSDSGDAPNAEAISIRVIRRTFNFLEGGTNFEGELDGVRVQNNLLVGIGVVNLGDSGASTSLIIGTYVQTGQKLDMNITTIGIQPTWYVSKDGSVIHGTRIDQAVTTQGVTPFLSFLITRDWTLVENDTCDAEGV